MPDFEVEHHGQFELEHTTEASEIGITLGDLYVPTAAEAASQGAIIRSDFQLTADATTVFVIDSLARQLMHVMINGIDYVHYCQLDSTENFGHVTYSVPSGGYEPEIGDSVVIYWTK